MVLIYVDGFDASMQIAVEFGYGYTFLFHGVAFTNCDGVGFEGVVIDSDAEWGADGILTTIAAADGILLVVL